MSFKRGNRATFISPSGVELGVYEEDLETRLKNDTLYSSEFNMLVEIRELNGNGLILIYDETGEDYRIYSHR